MNAAKQLFLFISMLPFVLELCVNNVYIAHIWLRNNEEKVNWCMDWCTCYKKFVTFVTFRFSNFCHFQCWNWSQNRGNYETVRHSYIWISGELWHTTPTQHLFLSQHPPSFSHYLFYPPLYFTFTFTFFSKIVVIYSSENISPQILSLPVSI